MNNPNQKKQLIVFDVEGVLIPKNRFIYETGKTLGFFQLIKVLFFGFFYEIGVFSLKTALSHIYYLMKKIEINTLIEVFNRIPSLPHIEHIFQQLKIRKYKIALISSGLPSILVKKLGDFLGADYTYGVEIRLNNNLLTGEISGDVIDKNGKLKVMKKILAMEGLSQKHCVVVGDDRNNKSIFLPHALKIGFNPDFILRVKANRVVNGNLDKILPVIDRKEKRRSWPSRNDFFREITHASGFFIPIIAGLIGIIPMSLVISIIMVIFFTSELFRLNGRDFPIISIITKNTVSKSEIYDFAAAPLYFGLGILLTLLLFPIQVSSASIAIFAWGDSAASIFGSRISKKPFLFNKDKTIEGSFAGFLFGFVAALFFVSPITAAIGAAVAMFFEYLPLPINDNLVVPISTGLILSLIV